MEEYKEWINDYIECEKKIKGFDNYQYEDTMIWSFTHYTNWINKKKEYNLALTGEINNNIDNRQKAWNAVNNFKILLEKIAMIEGYKIMY